MKLRVMYCVFSSCLILAMPSAMADPPANPSVTRNVPDLLPPDGCQCADTAVANVIKFFSEKGFPALVPKGTSNDDLVKKIETLKPGGGTTGTADATIAYIKEKGYEGKLLVESKNPPTFKSIKDEWKKGQLLVLNLRVGNTMLGHTVTVVGWSDVGGVRQIGIHDINPPSTDPRSADYTGSDADGTDWYKITETSDGFSFG